MLKTIFVVLLILLLCVLVFGSQKKMRENFTGKSKFITFKNDDLYDDFYADVYDKLVYSPSKNKFELKAISKYIQKGKALDIGSGTGHHVDDLNKKGFDCVGLDSSKGMIEQAKIKFPQDKFVYGNALKPMTFQPNSFDLITCLYFTVYYIKDKEQFFKNVALWLSDGGYFVLHLVDKNKFNPIVPAGEPFTIISPQNYADERIEDSVVQFDKFKYKSNFSLPEKNKGVFKEYFKFKDSNQVRQNDHTFYMESQREIVQQVKNMGLKLVETIDMSACNYDNQYLYIFQK
jgi:SAM-dependent methyltransferase